MFQYVIDCSILSGYRTDHSVVLLKLKLQENERGHGYWKFNNSLLKDTGYIKIVKDTNFDVKNTYRIPLNNNDNHIVADANDHRNSNDMVNTNTTTTNNSYNTINNNNNNNNDNDNNDNNNNNNNEEEDNFSINDQLLLETILFTIRGETIKYSSMKKKLNMEKEIQLEREIKGLEQNINDNLMTIYRETIDSLIDKKNTPAELRQNKIEGVMLRSRCRYENLGEKPSGYFLNLESRNYINKVMTKIVDESGNEYTNAKDIIEQQRKYYSKLYKEEVNIDDISTEISIGSNPNKLSQTDAMKLEGEITDTELAHALQSMKNSKSPGNDGFTVEFFNFFLEGFTNYYSEITKFCI